MGNNKLDNRFIGEQFGGGWDRIYDSYIDLSLLILGRTNKAVVDMAVVDLKKVRKMAEAKVVAWILTFIGIPAYAFAIYVNLTTWKSDVLFITAFGLIWVRAYYMIKQKNQALRKENQEAYLRDLEIRIKEREFNGD